MTLEFMFPRFPGVSFQNLPQIFLTEKFLFLHLALDEA